MSEVLLRVEAVRKDFPGLRALDRVSFELGGGEILAVVGQNGSGKSTLVKVLAGVIAADAGAAELRGKRFLDGPHRDHVDDLHFIHQNRGLVTSLSTIENLDLGRTRPAGGILPLARRRERRRTEELIQGFGLSFDVTRPVGEISPTERTIVAIIRALEGWMRPDGVLVLDEPTAELHSDEVGKLFTAMRRVTAAGAGVIFISHRLDEVIATADRVLALRDGRVVGDISDAIDNDRLVEMVVGEKVADLGRASRVGGGEVVLETKGLAGATVCGLDLRLRAGEVVGVGGISGSGREAIAPLIFGAVRRRAGEVVVDGMPLRADDPAAAIAAGLALAPADRHRHGVIANMRVRENLTLPGLRSLRRFVGRLDGRRERAEARRWVDRVGLRPPDPERRIDQLSGGNQQKVVIARWLRLDPRVLLLDEPTQGVDIGAKVAVYDLVATAASEGAAVLVCSADAKELAAVCDRVLVMREGRCRAELVGAELDEQQVVREELGLDPSLPASSLIDKSEENGIHA